MKTRLMLLSVAAVVAMFSLVACGGDEEAEQAATQAQEEVDELRQELQEQEAEAKREARAAARKAARAAARKADQEAAVAPAAEPEPAAPSSPPDVVGLTLPAAKKALKAAGYSADVSNTDTALGIIVESNYTVCTQDAPRGTVVPILAQKYGC